VSGVRQKARENRLITQVPQQRSAIYPFLQVSRECDARHLLRWTILVNRIAD
jgi:hypothetical protein